MTTAIATVPSVTDPRELALLKAIGLDRANPEQRELALNIAARYQLDVMLKHLVLIDGKPYITRDGLLHVAHRDGALDGIVTTEPVLVDGYWRSTCSVYRKDMSHPFTYTGRYPEKGQNAKFAPEMAVKGGEVMALRRAFDVAAPVAEERWDVEVPTPDPTPKPTLAAVAAEKRAAVTTPVAPITAVHEHHFVNPRGADGSPTFNEPVCSVCGIHEYAIAEPVEAPTVEAFPVAGGCGWSLQLKDKSLVPCTLGEMHAAEHSFTKQAIESGGRVVRSD